MRSEIAILQTVGVSLEGEDLGVVDEAVDHRHGDGVVAEDLAPGREGLVGGDDQAGVLVAPGDEHEHEVGRLWVKGDVADLVADQERDALEALSSSSRRPRRWASASCATHSVAVLKQDALAGQASAVDIAIARCVLPVPGGPNRITFSRACRKSSWPRCSITCFLIERWKVKSNSSSVFLAGKRAARMRASPPCASVRRSRSRAAPRRSAHSSTPPRGRARRASGSAFAAAGAFIARNRCGEL